MKTKEIQNHEGKTLIVENGENTDGLEMKLIESIDSRYLLHPSFSVTAEGICHFDISSYETFSHYLINRKLNVTEMTAILAQAKNVLQTLEDHMLGDANLLLYPESVYIDLRSRKLRFVPVCSLKESFSERLKPFAEALFMHADLEDTESLRFAAKVLKVSMEEDVKMYRLMKLVEERHFGSAEETGGKEEKEPEKPRQIPKGKNGILMGGNCEEATMRLTDGGEPVQFSMDEEVTEREEEEKGIAGFVSGIVSGIRNRLGEEEE